MSSLREHAQNTNFWHLIQFNDWIKDYLSKFQLCHFFYFLDPQSHVKFQTKLMIGLWGI